MSFEFLKNAGVVVQDFRQITTSDANGTRTT